MGSFRFLALTLGCTSGGRSHFVPFTEAADVQAASRDGTDFLSALFQPPSATGSVADVRRAMLSRGLAFQFPLAWIDGQKSVFEALVDAQCAHRRPAMTIMKQAVAISKFDVGARYD